MTREMTRFEHRWEISEAGGWRDFAEVADELSLWIDRRAWTTGDGPKAIVDGALGWLRQRQVLLPALDSLTRLVSQVVGAAHRRLWETLLELITAEQARALLGLLEVGEGERISPLERLRRGPVDRTAEALVAELNRVAEVAGSAWAGWTCPRCRTGGWSTWPGWAWLARAPVLWRCDGVGRTPSRWLRCSPLWSVRNSLFAATVISNRRWPSWCRRAVGEGLWRSSSTLR